MDLMKTAPNIYLTLAAMLFLAGCGANNSQLTQTEDAGPSLLATGLPEISGIVHLTSAAGDFMPQQNGADFANDLENANVATFGTNAVFDSSWIEATSSLSDSAYCLYRLELLDSLTNVKLELNWGGSTPDDCWLALANWDTLSWDWHFAGSVEMVDITDPAPYRDESNRCFAAVVVLSGLPVELVEIGISGQGSGDGYTLFAPLKSTTTLLIDMDGTTVHSWESAWLPGNSVELTEDGGLLRTCMLNNPAFSAGGTGGRLEKLDWDSNVVWSYELSSPSACQHHDFELLPSGNILLVVWQKHSKVDAIAAGRDPDNFTRDEIWVDSIIEIEPLAVGANVVWEWHLWDHLVQDFDPAQANYSVVAEHPELVDINFGPAIADWNHVNSVAYNAELDQIVISSHNQNELWVIDHSTTTAEAALHSGGASGKGGDLLYRWGNPLGYGAGTVGDQVLFGQHNIHWIADGLRGAGNLLVYNNGLDRPAGDFSNIIELATPVLADGSYPLSGGTWEPQSLAWEYLAVPPTDFYSRVISGVQRLPGGNTLVCEGTPGRFFEVDTAGVIQWEYLNIVGPGPQGAPVFRCTRYSPDYPGLAMLAP